jgi:acyl carrier protein
MNHLDTLREIICEHLGISPGDITPQSNLINDLGADSLDCVEIIMAIEEEYSIEIPDEDAEKLETIQQILDYL